MNYIEWVLQRGIELWREREETLKKPLPLVPEGAKEGKTGNAPRTENEPATQDAQMRESGESAAPDDPTAAVIRLGRKLAPGTRQEDGETEETGVLSVDPVSTAAGRAALLHVKGAESADDASGWMQKLLSADGRDGASAAAMREKNDFSLAREQEVRETESFSLSLERDARRYDGGFLFY